MSLTRQSGWIPSAFRSPQDEFDPNLARRPVVLDVLGPDMKTSLLGTDLKLVLHVNPSSISVTRQKLMTTANTERGRVRWHYGQSVYQVSMEAATGGFVRMYAGLTGLAAVSRNAPSRRETIAYERYRDLLALFRNNGSVYSSVGTPIHYGIVVLSYDGVSYRGWFGSFTSSEESGRQYQFTVSADMQATRERRLLNLPPG